ncbi:MAG TPA: low temperature requirement protein A [Gaiellaceae bacterium]|nr:low temperature requirement protein A [Gaiellaceae bacterium]
MSLTHRAEGEERVSPLELFFDLVFVFAITQVTGLVTRNPTWRGVAEGIVVLALLWWAWTAYAWLTGTVDPEDGVTRLAIFAAMGAMLIASLAVPHAFGDDAWLFVATYVAVRIGHLVLYTLVGRGDRELLGAISRIAVGLSVGIILLSVGAALGGTAQIVFWAVTIVVDMLGALIRGSRGWHLAVGHFAERHGLIIIIALGESVVALGAGTLGQPLDAGVIAAALLGLAVGCALWWGYFDVVAIAAERRLRRAEGREALSIARDSYSYLHLPMVIGIIFFAVGVKKTLVHVGDPLHLVPAVALCGGVALYQLAHVAFRLRNMGTWGVRRLVCAGILLALIPVSLALPALVTLALVAVVSAGLIAYEAIRYADARERLRRAALSPG